MKKNILYLVGALLLITIGYFGIKKLFGVQSSLSQITHYPVKTDKDKRWGFIDLDGNVIIDNEWENEPSVACNGITLVKNKGGLYEYYIVDEKPKKIGEEYKSATLFCDGIAIVSKENSPLSLIDKSGKEIAIIKEIGGKLVEACNQFNEGLAAYKNEDGLWGFINKEGFSVIDAKYNDVNNFSEGSAKVTITENDKVKVAFINPKGEYIIQPTDEIDFAPSFAEGLVGYTDDEAEWGYMDKKSEKVIKSIKDFKGVGLFSKGLATFFDGDKYGVINKKGEIILRAKYENISINDGLFIIKDNGKVGVINEKTEEIVKVDYDGAAFLCNGNIVAVDGKKVILLDRKGKEVNKTSFEEMRIFSYDNQAISDYFDGVGATDKILKGLVYGQIKGVSKSTNIISLIKNFELDKTEYKPSQQESLNYRLLSNESKAKLEAQKQADSIAAATRAADSLAALEGYMLLDTAAFSGYNDNISKDDYPYLNSNTTVLQKTKYFGYDVSCIYSFVFNDVIKTAITEDYTTSDGWYSYTRQRTIGYVINKETTIKRIVLTVELTGKGYGKSELLMGKFREKLENVGYKISKVDDNTFNILNKSSLQVGKFNKNNGSSFEFWIDIN